MQRVDASQKKAVVLLMQTRPRGYCQQKSMHGNKEEHRDQRLSSEQNDATYDSIRIPGAAKRNEQLHGWFIVLFFLALMLRDSCSAFERR